VIGWREKKEKERKAAGGSGACAILYMRLYDGNQNDVEV
jgi:hypothetical protein